MTTSVRFVLSYDFLNRTLSPLMWIYFQCKYCVVMNVVYVSVTVIQNIDCGYTLEPPRRGGSSVYSQSMFWAILHTPAYPKFTI